MNEKNEGGGAIILTQKSEESCAPNLQQQQKWPKNLVNYSHFIKRIGQIGLLVQIWLHFMENVGKIVKFVNFSCQRLAGFSVMLLV